ncbi:hypothetical protein DPMN_145767 [Dreissena polymorpha]|uniref:Uncharacterized protein n=1 Tax=Dreissena polymorpha TaxID=45954 RepID=A0A9D4IXU9_DREPO|nr:hypothetical protein DPMN_145767 [Dreissena polymorpha]
MVEHIDDSWRCTDVRRLGRILDREPSWIERGVKEAIYIRALRPVLNKDRGRYKLSHTWDLVLHSLCLL